MPQVAVSVDWTDHDMLYLPNSCLEQAQPKKRTYQGIAWEIPSLISWPGI